LKASEVMSLGVVTISREASVKEAACTMLREGVSGLPVVDASGQLVGIVTEGDFLRRSEIGTQRRRPRCLEFLLGPDRLAAEYVHQYGRKISEIMTPEVITISEDTPLQDLVEIMEGHRIKRVPVARNSKVVGIQVREIGRKSFTRKHTNPGLFDVD
jgi:CBS domain-containing protein